MVTIIKKLTGGAYPFYEYACLSTDIKPVSLVPENSICHEIDTGKHFYFGNGQWKELPPKGGSGGGSAYTLPTASADTKGGVKIGSGLTMTGEVLSATDGGAEKFVVTLTKENDTWTADKTVSEIVAAYGAGKIVVAKYPRDGINIDIPLNMAIEYQGIYGARFIGFVNSGNNNTVVAVQFVDEGSGAAITIIEQQIPTSTNAPLIVTMTEDQQTLGTYVGDKTNKEAYDAFVAGRPVVAYLSAINTAFSCLAVNLADTTYSIAFTNSIVSEGGENDNISVVMGN